MFFTNIFNNQYADTSDRIHYTGRAGYFSLTEKKACYYRRNSKKCLRIKQSFKLLIYPDVAWKIRKKRLVKKDTETKPFVWQIVNPEKLLDGMLSSVVDFIAALHSVRFADIARAILNKATKEIKAKTSNHTKRNGKKT